MLFQVVEICFEDEIQSKGLALVLRQLKSHRKATDPPAQQHYHLLRFILTKEASCLGFKTFLILINYSLTPSGRKLVDYNLLHTCLLTIWNKLLRMRCTDAEAPTGRRSLFECLLTILLDLIVEENANREANLSLFKANKFDQTLLSICTTIVTEQSLLTGFNNLGDVLGFDDARKIGALIKELFDEMIAPPDPSVVLTIVKFGLYPLLPKDIPPLPHRSDAYFVFPGSKKRYVVQQVQVSEVARGVEIAEDPEVSKNTKTEEGCHNSSDALNNAEDRDNASFPSRMEKANEDIPEILGRTVLNNKKLYSKETFENQQLDCFHATMMNSLTQTCLSIVTDAVGVLSDTAFNSVLGKVLTPHLFVAYCAHPSSEIKNLALKLLSAYLSRIKNPQLTEFYHRKGFFLTSLYIQDCEEVANVVASICNGFGPTSYPLMVSLLRSSPMVNLIIEWVHSDKAAVVSNLTAVGFFPAVFNTYKKLSTVPRPLAKLLSMVIQHCVTSPVDELWRNSLCPALDTAPQGSSFTGKLFHESISYLRQEKTNTLSQSQGCSRLLWLLERSSIARLGPQFDKWLLILFTQHIMEIEEQDESELWRAFVRKNKKRCTYLLGVFLCRLFTPNKGGDNDCKQWCLRTMIPCPHLNTWLPKVLKTDEQIERCFTAFIRIFFIEASCVNANPSLTQITRNLIDDPLASISSRGLRPVSFQSLMIQDCNILVQQQNNLAKNTNNEVAGTVASTSTSSLHQMSDQLVRAKFEELLVDTGILSPTNNFSVFSPDFRQFKTVLRCAPNSGVSYQELRRCLVTVEKMREGVNKKACGTDFSFMLQNRGSSKSRNNNSSSAYYDFVFDEVLDLATDIVDTVTTFRTHQEITIAKEMSWRDEEIRARDEMWSLMQRLSHPKAPWHFKELYPK